MRTGGSVAPETWTITQIDAGAYLIAAPRSPRRPDPPELARQMVRALDRRLRRAEAIVEFSARPDCVLRIARTQAARPLALADGVRLRSGDATLDLHFWNEHMPPIGDGQGALGWGARFRRRLGVSLRELAGRLEDDPALADVRAIHGRLSLSRHAEAQRRFGEHLGFEVIPTELSVGARVHDAFENLWLAALSWTFNPGRSPSLRRARTELWMSRAALLHRYGRQRDPMAA